MKTQPIRTPIKLAVLALLSAFSLPPAAFGQGSLTPPGAPAPTMKSLDQIEARTAITNTSSLVTISQPGSYYLTHNLTVSTGDAIHIATNGVTLDLNGFTLSSTAASATGCGILINSSLQDITIANGHIRGGVTNNAGIYSGSGFGDGIGYEGSAPANVLVLNVSVSGCRYHGICLVPAIGGDSTVVEGCTVRTVGGDGIFASTVKKSSALDCGGNGIHGYEAVSGCLGESRNNGYGIDTRSAQNCCGFSSGGYGISATTALNCYGYSGSGTGLTAGTAQNCYGNSLGSGTGIYANVAENCYGNSDGGGKGVYATRVAQNCCGYSNGGGGYGIYAPSIAIGCYGFSSSGTGVHAFIANLCHGETGSGTALSATHNVNSY